MLRHLEPIALGALTVTIYAGAAGVIAVLWCRGAALLVKDHLR